MRKLIMWNLMTLDGYFEGPQAWDVGFLEYAWGEELERFSLEQAREVGGLLYGRVTYDGMAAHWTTETGEIADFMNTVPKYVFSRTLESDATIAQITTDRDAVQRGAFLTTGFP